MLIPLPSLARLCLVSVAFRSPDATAAIRFPIHCPLTCAPPGPSPAFSLTADSLDLKHCLRYAPLSANSLMSDVPQTYLPDELVHAILTWMWYRDKDDEHIKRGLTSCSLTCRHWASRIRPLLFFELIIRSTEDVVQLLAFLDGPDVLHPSLQDCIKRLRVIEDRTSSSISWSHQIFRLHRRIPKIRSVFLTIETSGTDDDLRPERNSSQSLAIIPKTLPGSIMPLKRLTLSNVRLPSVKALANYVEHLHTPETKLNAVTFVKDDVPDIRRRRSHSSSEPTSITVSRCFEDIADIQHWLKISNVLHACQGRLWVDDAHLTLAEKYMSIILSLSPHRRDRTRSLQTIFYRRTSP